MRRSWFIGVACVAVALAAGCGDDGGSTADAFADTSPVFGGDTLEGDAVAEDTAVADSLQPMDTTVGSDTASPTDTSVPQDTAVAEDTATPQDTIVAQDTAPPQDTAVAEDTTQVDTGPTAPTIVDPGCIDGQYDEPLPNDSASITALSNSYSPADYAGFVDQVLQARYPIGEYLVTQGVAEYTNQSCLALFAQGYTSTAKKLVGQLSTIVHECGHFLDGARGPFGGNTYVFRPDLAITCNGGDARNRFGNTFARSEITNDEYDALWPNDFYKSTYLVGQGSEQGFNMVAEEAVQYINSLATDWAFRDNIGQGYSITARDGILTFLFYIQRYLRYARLNDTEAHDFLLDTPCWRKVILTIWGRAWLYLDESEGISSLGIDDDALLELVLRPELLEEIDLVRAAEGCP